MSDKPLADATKQILDDAHKMIKQWRDEGKNDIAEEFCEVLGIDPDAPHEPAGGPPGG